MTVLKSPRFQALVILALVSYVASMGYINDQVYTMFMTVLAGFIGIRTIDRFSEKVGKK